MTIKLKRRINRGVSGDIVTVFVIALLGVFMILPVVYIVGNALKPMEELYKFPPTLFPQNPTFGNFHNLFTLVAETTMPFLRYVFNTIFMTAVAAAGQIILASLCAYSLSKIPFPGSKFIFSMIVFSLMFSGSVTTVPRFIIFAKIGLVDTYAGMILPALVSTMGLYLMKQFMENTVPNELLEAGRIDGAGELKIFFGIVMPLLKPAWFTLIILSIQTLWGATSSYTYSEVFKTLPQALAQLSNGAVTRAGVTSAASLLMLVIPVTCFVVMQSKIVDTMGSAGLKG